MSDEELRELVRLLDALHAALYDSPATSSTSSDRVYVAGARDIVLKHMGLRTMQSPMAISR